MTPTRAAAGPPDTSTHGVCPVNTGRIADELNLPPLALVAEVGKSEARGRGEPVD